MSKIGSHKIAKGDPLFDSITATGWNRAQDAADHVLGQKLEVKRGEASVPPQKFTQFCNVLISTNDWNSEINKIPSTSNFGVGSAIPLMNRMYTQSACKFVPNGRGINWDYVDNEYELDRYQVFHKEFIGSFVHSNFAMQNADNFGVVTQDLGYVDKTLRGRSTETYRAFRAIVKGIFKCRVYAFALSDRCTGMMTVPDASNRYLHRSYPTVSNNGSARVLGFGRYWSLTGGSSGWPRVYEAILEL